MHAAGLAPTTVTIVAQLMSRRVLNAVAPIWPSVTTHVCLKEAVQAARKLTCAGSGAAGAAGGIAAAIPGAGSGAAGGIAAAEPGAADAADADVAAAAEPGAVRGNACAVACDVAGAGLDAEVADVVAASCASAHSSQSAAWWPRWSAHAAHWVQPVPWSVQFARLHCRFSSACRRERVVPWAVFIRRSSESATPAIVLHAHGCASDGAKSRCAMPAMRCIMTKSRSRLRMRSRLLSSMRVSADIMRARRAEGNSTRLLTTCSSPSRTASAQLSTPSLLHNSELSITRASSVYWYVAFSCTPISRPMSRTTPSVRRSGVELRLNANIDAATIAM